jgi:3D (Asp-Asp-Asp) domain-containing protein
MSRLAAALLLFGAGLTGATTTTYDDSPAVTVGPSPSVRHRHAPFGTSRSMRRLSLPRHPRDLPGKARSHRRLIPSVRSHVLPVGARQLLTVTAYCATGSRNAAGRWPTVGTAAGNAWPLGTRLYVQSVGVVVVEDRSAPGATDVDVYLGSDAGCEQRAAAWGRRQLHVQEVAA